MDQNNLKSLSNPKTGFVGIYNPHTGFDILKIVYLDQPRIWRFLCLRRRLGMFIDWLTECDKSSLIIIRLKQGCYGKMVINPEITLQMGRVGVWGWGVDIESRRPKWTKKRGWEDSRLRVHNHNVVSSVSKVDAPFAMHCAEWSLRQTKMPWTQDGTIQIRISSNWNDPSSNFAMPEHPCSDFSPGCKSGHIQKSCRPAKTAWKRLMKINMIIIKLRLHRAKQDEGVLLLQLLLPWLCDQSSGWLPVTVFVLHVGSHENLSMRQNTSCLHEGWGRLTNKGYCNIWFVV